MLPTSRCEEWQEREVSFFSLSDAGKRCNRVLMIFCVKSDKPYDESIAMIVDDGLYAVTHRLAPLLSDV